MQKAIIKLYEIQELGEKAKRKAIEEHRTFLLSVMCKDDFITGDPAYDTPEEVEKAFAAEYSYYLLNDTPIIENIEANEYLFYKSGDLANLAELDLIA